MKSIRTKIVFVSCIICICSILLATIISYKVLSENIKNQTLEKLDEISQKHAAEIEGWFDVQARILNELYDELIYRNDFDKTRLINYLNYKEQKNPDIIEYYIAFPDNVFVRGVGFWVPEGDYKAVEREWYKKAVESHDIEISSPYVDANHGELIFTFSKAIRVNDEIIGVLCSDISIDHIVNIINESRPSVEGYGFLVDNNGNILAHPNKEFLYSKSKGLKNIKDAYCDDLFVKYIGEKELKTIVDYDDIEKYLLYTNLGNTGLDIGLAAPVDEVMEPLNKIVDSSISLAIILTIISVLLTFIIGNSISKPIVVATDYIEQMAKLDITEDIDEDYLKMKDEIGRMFNSFQMIVNSLRYFLNNLTSISTRVSTFSDELAVLSYQSSKDIDSIAQDSNNMAELSDKQMKNISNFIIAMDNLKKEVNKIILIKEFKNDETIINPIKEILSEIIRLEDELNQIKNIRTFQSVQINNIYSLIEKQTLTMEEISSASQCLAELGEELNIYIAKFKS